LRGDGVYRFCGALQMLAFSVGYWICRIKEKLISPMPTITSVTFQISSPKAISMAEIELPKKHK
jgi:hypothetical protein